MKGFPSYNSKLSITIVLTISYKDEVKVPRSTIEKQENVVEMRVSNLLPMNNLEKLQ